MKCICHPWKNKDEQLCLACVPGGFEPSITSPLLRITKVPHSPLMCSASVTGSLSCPLIFPHFLMFLKPRSYVALCPVNFDSQCNSFNLFDLVSVDTFPAKNRIITSVTIINETMTNNIINQLFTNSININLYIKIFQLIY